MTRLKEIYEWEREEGVRTRRKARRDNGGVMTANEGRIDERREGGEKSFLEHRRDTRGQRRGQRKREEEEKREESRNQEVLRGKKRERIGFDFHYPHVNKNASRDQSECTKE
eukprot:768286-Hanusia_phi.AAC.1